MFTDEAIALLNEEFVCFAPGWYINDDDEVYQAAWKRFYTAKPNEGEGNGWLQGTQLVLMTSSGRLLSGAMTYGDRGSLEKALREVLASYASLPQSQRRAESVPGDEKPQPAPPPGGLVLTVYDRPLWRDAEGGYHLPQDGQINPASLRLAAPGGQRSSLWLTADECASLMPDDPRPGQSFAVAEQLARRLLIYGMWPNSLWVVEVSWLPNSLREGHLELTVEDVSPEAVRMRIHGRARLAGQSGHKGFEGIPIGYDANVEGVLEFDPATKRITRWDMAALGDYTGEWFAEDGGRWREAKPEAPLALAVALEIDETAYKHPPERRRPRSFVHAYIFGNNEEHYWNPIQWEQDWRARQQK